MFSSIKRVFRWPVSVPVMAVIIACYFYADQFVAEAVYKHPQLYQFPLFRSLTILGSWSLMLTMVVIIYILCRLLKVNKTIRIVLFQISLTLLACNLVGIVLKMLLGRARPVLWLKQHLYGFYGPSINPAFWSFPSGHTLTVMAIAWSLCVAYPKYIAIWLILGFSVVATRIILIQHYLSDIMTSIYLALILAVAIHQYRRRWEAWA